jgi:hypothetical protein
LRADVRISGRVAACAATIEDTNTTSVVTPRKTRTMT